MADTMHVILLVVCITAYNIKQYRVYYITKINNIVYCIQQCRVPVEHPHDLPQLHMPLPWVACGNNSQARNFTVRHNYTMRAHVGGYKSLLLCCKKFILLNSTGNFCAYA